MQPLFEKTPLDIGTAVQTWPKRVMQSECGTCPERWFMGVIRGRSMTLSHRKKRRRTDKKILEKILENLLTQPFEFGHHNKFWDAHHSQAKCLGDMKSRIQVKGHHKVNKLLSSNQRSGRGNSREHP